MALYDLRQLNQPVDKRVRAAIGALTGLTVLFLDRV